MLKSRRSPSISNSVRQSVHDYCRLTSLTLVILCNRFVRPLGFIRHRRRLGGSPPASVGFHPSEGRISLSDVSPTLSLNVERSETYRTAVTRYIESRQRYIEPFITAYRFRASARKYMMPTAGPSMSNEVRQFMCRKAQFMTEGQFMTAEPSIHRLNLTRSVRFHRRKAAIFVHDYCRLTSLTLMILCNRSVRPLGFIRHRRRLGGSPPSGGGFHPPAGRISLSDASPTLARQRRNTAYCLFPTASELLLDKYRILCYNAKVFSNIVCFGRRYYERILMRVSRIDRDSRSLRRRRGRQAY